MEVLLRGIMAENLSATAKLLESNQTKTDKMVEDIGKKVSKEMKEVIAPINKKLEAAEVDRDKMKKDMNDMKGKMEAMAKEVDLIKEGKRMRIEADEETDEPIVVQSRYRDMAALPRVAPKLVTATDNTNAAAEKKKAAENENKKKKAASENRSVLDRAARTVSLFPITREHVMTFKKDLDKDTVESNIDNFPKAMELAVQEYLEWEMKITEEEFKDMGYLEIFHPKGEDWRTLYLELETLQKAEWILSQSQHIHSTEPKVGNHVPWQARERHSAFQAKALIMRRDGKKTRVVIRNGEYVLRFRDKSNVSAKWEEWKGSEDTPELVDPEARRGTEKSPSKAKGRAAKPTNSKHNRSPDSAKNDVPKPKRKKGFPLASPDDTVINPGWSVDDASDEEEEAEEEVNEDISEADTATTPVNTNKDKSNK